MVWGYGDHDGVFLTNPKQITKNKVSVETRNAQKVYSISLINLMHNLFQSRFFDDSSSNTKKKFTVPKIKYKIKHLI